MSASPVLNGLIAWTGGQQLGKQIEGKYQGKVPKRIKLEANGIPGRDKRQDKSVFMLTKTQDSFWHIFTVLCLKQNCYCFILFYPFSCCHEVTEVVLNMIAACSPFLTSILIVYDLFITFDIDDHPLYLQILALLNFRTPHSPVSILLHSFSISFAGSFSSFLHFIF